MTTPKLTLAGYILGSLIIILSIQRWWFVYYTLSKVFFGGGIGGLIIVMSYIYSWMRGTDEWKVRIQRQCDALGALETGNAFEAVKEEAMGIKS